MEQSRISWRGVSIKYPMKRKFLVLERVNFLCFIGSLLVILSLWSNLVFYSLKHSLCPPTFFIRKRACLNVFPNHSRISSYPPPGFQGVSDTFAIYHTVIAIFFLLQGKNDTTYLVDKMFVTSITRTRIKCEEIKLSCQFFFFLTVMIF